MMVIVYKKDCILLVTYNLGYQHNSHTVHLTRTSELMLKRRWYMVVDHILVEGLRDVEA